MKWESVDKKVQSRGFLPRLQQTSVDPFPSRRWESGWKHTSQNCMDGRCWRLQKQCYQHHSLVLVLIVYMLLLCVAGVVCEEWCRRYSSAWTHCYAWSARPATARRLPPRPNHRPRRPAATTPPRWTRASATRWRTSWARSRSSAVSLVCFIQPAFFHRDLCISFVFLLLWNHSICYPNGQSVPPAARLTPKAFSDDQTLSLKLGKIRQNTNLRGWLRNLLLTSCFCVCLLQLYDREERFGPFYAWVNTKGLSKQKVSIPCQKVQLFLFVPILHQGRFSFRTLCSKNRHCFGRWNVMFQKTRRRDLLCRDCFVHCQKAGNVP